MDKNYFVYILSSRSHTLYTGVTNDVLRRVMQHRQGSGSNFSSRYRIHRRVHVETFVDVNSTIRREKEIKSWSRAKRVALIERDNPTWEDQIADFAPPYPRTKQIPRYARDDKSLRPSLKCGTELGAEVAEVATVTARLRPLPSAPPATGRPRD